VKRVLIVEDDDDIREVLGELLGERYDVELATDGAEALAVLDRVTVDAIVLDLMMPVMDLPPRDAGAWTFTSGGPRLGDARPSGARSEPARGRALHETVFA